MKWAEVTTPRFVAFTIAIVVLGIVEVMPPLGWCPILDSANLMFHEAGHPIFGLLGEAAGLYGGTIGQLVFPLVISVEFFRRRATMSLAVGSLWFFQNFFNIARYAADARAQVIPLVGSGDHDWWNIFVRWGVLEHDVTIGITIAVTGGLGIMATWLWTGWLWFKGQNTDTTLEDDNDLADGVNE